MKKETTSPARRAAQRRYEAKKGAALNKPKKTTADVYKWRAKYPEKQKARNLTCSALRNGTLVRPDQCVKCQKECKPDAHHEDYTKPLQVTWLCRQCHGLEHRIDK